MRMPQPMKRLGITSWISLAKLARNATLRQRVAHAHARHACKTDRIRGETANDVALKLIPVRPSWPSRPLWNKADPEGSPLSGGSRQWDLKNDPSLPPITQRVVASPSLIETSFQHAWKTIYSGADPRGEKSVSHKARPYISPRNIIARAVDTACSLYAFAKTRSSARRTASRRSIFKPYIFLQILHIFPICL